MGLVVDDGLTHADARLVPALTTSTAVFPDNAFSPGPGVESMNYVQTTGIVLTVAGVTGYVIGIFAAYPGRGFSLAGVMVGLTLLSVGGAFR